MIGSQGTGSRGRSPEPEPSGFSATSATPRRTGALSPPTEKLRPIS